MSWWGSLEVKYFFQTQGCWLCACESKLGFQFTGATTLDVVGSILWVEPAREPNGWCFKNESTCKLLELLGFNWLIPTRDGWKLIEYVQKLRLSLHEKYQIYSNLAFLWHLFQAVPLMNQEVTVRQRLIQLSEVLTCVKKEAHSTDISFQLKPFRANWSATGECLPSALDSGTGRAAEFGHSGSRDEQNASRTNWVSFFCIFWRSCGVVCEVFYSLNKCTGFRPRKLRGRMSFAEGCGRGCW